MGNSTIGTKRHVRRYDYCECVFSNVSLRTPGTVSLDQDGDLHFFISGVEHDIDVRKPEWEAIKPLYHALIYLQREQHQNLATLQLQKELLAKLQINVKGRCIYNVICNFVSCCQSCHLLIAFNV